MCYMSETDGRPARVGVRELRQNLSVYLDRVKAGETLVVTEHGEPVARLGPPPKDSIIDQMIADGRITPATRDHRRATMPPPMPDDYDGPTATEILLQMREEERY
jgi:prevent-host-death family protein